MIANTLYLSKDIERWGSGIKRIYDACRDEGVRVEFKKLKSGFLVVFYRSLIKEGLVEGLVENQRKILALVSEKPYISKREMSERIGISSTAVDKNITTLKKKGLLKRIGPAKGGYWKVVEKVYPPKR